MRHMSMRTWRELEKEKLFFSFERVACVTHALGGRQVAEVAPRTQKEIASMAAFCGYKFSKPVP